MTHNFSPALSTWVLGQPVLASRHDTFVAGDLYGDRVEQLVVSKLLLHLGRSRPAEFMTSRCVNLSDHVRTKSEEELTAQAMAAASQSSAFLVIDAVDPVGTVNAAVYDRIGRVFSTTAAFEPYTGGEPVEDVAVYFSVDSQMDFAENGTAVAAVGTPHRSYPHLRAVRGACRALQRAHVPFGVVTRALLDDLDRYQAVVLPNVLRMSREEVDAFRRYVQRGGGLYASGYTSLVDSEGTRHDDFLLGDVFGVRFVGEEQGSLVYVTPRHESVAHALGVQTHLSHVLRDDATGRGKALCSIPRLGANGGRALATLSVPYGYPDHGTAADHRWSSIHSSPPWDDVDAPVVVANDVGSGRCVYSAADLETVDAEANEQLFVSLTGSLAREPPAFETDAAPDVWVSLFDQRDRERMVLSLTNQAEHVDGATEVALTIRPPPDRAFTQLTEIPSGGNIAFEAGESGIARARVSVTGRLVLVVAEYAPRG